MIGITGFSFFKKSQSIIFTVAAVMISLGQWTDTRDIIVSGYESFITHFTDQVELKKLNDVRVGANLTYLEKVFGEARLIKVKDPKTDLQFRYYHGGKFLLTLAVVQHRVIGYQVISLQQGFMPPIAFSDLHLGEKALADYQTFSGSFNTDTSNLRYYLEPTTLGREGLFLERQLGFVEYGATAEIDAEPLTKLNALLMQPYEDEALLQLSHKVRDSLIPNVYSLGEMSLEQASDMLLTRYEFLAYFQSED